MPSITRIEALVTSLQADQRALLDGLYVLRSSTGRLHVPDTFTATISRWYGEADGVSVAEAQLLVRSMCRWSGEGSLFNPLRGRRPRPFALAGASSADDTAADDTAADDTDLERRIERAQVGCDFCDARQRTTEDVWGRVEGRHSITAANASKYDAEHGLVVFAEHHPLRFGRAQVRDYLAVANQWLERTRSERELPYGFIGWNCLPRSGASLIHGHLQVLANDLGPYGRQGLLAKAAIDYRAATGRGFWSDRVAVHDALGLGDRRDGLARFATLTPAKNREVVIVGGTAIDDRFAGVVADTLRAMIDRLGVRSFNCAIYPPEPGVADAVVIGRCVDRGDPRETSSDIGAMEMFGCPIISADPFDVTRALRR